MKTFIINSNGLKIEVGKTYYYYNIGLGEIKTHLVKGFSNNVWAYSHEGRVGLDSLFEYESDIK